MEITLILRHSEREKLTSPEQAPRAGLTLKGKLKALRQGLYVSGHAGNLHSTYTSPVKRCIDTASLMHTSMLARGIRPQFYSSEMLGNGYIDESQFEKWRHFMIFNSEWSSYSRLFRLWEKRGWLKLTLQDYGEALLKEFLQECNVLAVTHDCNIGPLFEFLSKKYGFGVTSDMICLLYTSPSPRDRTRSRMPSSA